MITIYYHCGPDLFIVLFKIKNIKITNNQYLKVVVFCRAQHDYIIIFIIIIIIWVRRHILNKLSSLRTNVQVDLKMTRRL